MPSRKEVAGWHRELAKWFKSIANMSEMTCTNELNLKRANLWEDRAAQVEAMPSMKTCETCIHFDDQFNDCLSSFDYLFENGADIEHCGTKFGCIHHEEK